MKMQSILLGMGCAICLISCGEKDADIERAVNEKLNTAGVHVTVHEGVATIVGACDDEAFKKNIERSVKSVEGVKTVVNNCQIPQPNVEPVVAAVIVNSDSDLDKSVGKVIKKYDGVSATVVGGIVTLSGEIKREQLESLIKSVEELNPKKVDNKLTVK